MSASGKMPETDAAPSLSVNLSSEIEPLVHEGYKNYLLTNLDLSIAQLGDAAALTASIHGEMSLESAHVLVLYGKALLASGTKQNSILAQEQVGQAMEAQLQEDLNTYPVASTSKAHIAFEGEPDFREIEALDVETPAEKSGKAQEMPVDAEKLLNGKAVDQAGPEPAAVVEDDVEDDGGKDTKQGDDAEGEEEAEEGEEPQGDDLAAAWEVLDLARAIYGRIDSIEAKHKVADMYLLLGDISMESENFPQALSDYQEARNMKKSLLSPDNREISECHFKVSLAHELLSQTENAIEELNKTLACLDRRQLILRDLMNDAAADSEKKKNAEQEMADIGELVQEVHAKIEDMKRDREERMQRVVELVGGASTGGASSAVKLDPAAPVNDLTSIIRSRKGKQVDESSSTTPPKRLAEEGEGDGQEEKRAKH